MKKVISFSLWGDNPKYCVGAIKNAELREKYYPDWITRFYVHKDVPPSYIEELQALDQTEIIIENREANWKGMYWRFEAISDPDVEVMLVRDTDSRFSAREVAAVDEFLKSDKKMHIMRDHPCHRYFVMPGMFGVKKGILDNMVDLCASFGQSDQYGTDYAFFDHLRPAIPSHLILTHDPFTSKIDFPTPREGLEYVGRVFDENDNIVEEHEEIIKNYLNR
tara:strand:- start:1831 stop:2493 length:663 start_codon:yes stop_codon:yes gene_type:complete